MSAWMPASLLGLYVVAVSASQLGDLVSLAWRIVMTPSIARGETMSGRGGSAPADFSWISAGKYSLILLLALSLPVLIPAFFGAAFKASILPAEVLLIGAACLSAKNVLGGGLQAMGSPWLASRADLIALAVTVITLPPLLWRFGILGAAAASTLAYATQLLGVLYGLTRVIQFRRAPCCEYQTRRKPKRYVHSFDFDLQDDETFIRYEERCHPDVDYRSRLQCSHAGCRAGA